MTALKMITKTRNWGRLGETIIMGYVDSAEVAALVPLPSREIDGQYVQITQVVLKSGLAYEVVGMPGA